MHNIIFKVVFMKAIDISERASIDLNGNDFLEVLGKNFAIEKNIDFIKRELEKIAIKRIEKMACNEGRMSIWGYRWREGTVLINVEPDVFDILDEFFALNYVEKDSKKEGYFKLTERGLEKYKELKLNTTKHS